MRLDAKKFQNEVCQACIKKNIKKYGEFKCQCDGITIEEDVKWAIRNGLDEHSARWMYDPCYFFEVVYGSPPRWYQKHILRCTSKNLITRQCRQSGKTLAIAFKLMHFLLTNEKKSVIVLTPQEKQIKKIFDEYLHRDCISANSEVKRAVVSSVQKPYYQIVFDNESNVKLMVANEGARGQTADWIYIDEAALINSEMLNSILLTVVSAGEKATILMSSTPRGRGNLFYKSCKEDPIFNEYHVPISKVEELKSQMPRFKKLLGELGYMQECEAEFPDVAGGPFNLRGVALSKAKYLYEEVGREAGMLYFGGVDWNGAAKGTYMYIVGFNPDDYTFKVVDKVVVSSVNWNQNATKQALLALNRKWNPKHWMTDYGYGHDTVESLRIYSMRIAKSVGNLDPDAMLKHTLETVEFGSFIDIKDPFTREEVKKTTKSFIVSQVARLFEVSDQDTVNIQVPYDDHELIESLENYSLLNITLRGIEQYGFGKKSGIEDHCIDAFMLAIYGVVKHYNEFFKRAVFTSAMLPAKEILAAPSEPTKKVYAGSIVLLTGNSPEPIELDDGKIRKFEPDNNSIMPIISRTMSRNGINRSGENIQGRMNRRSGIIKRIF